MIILVIISVMVALAIEATNVIVLVITEKFSVEGYMNIGMIETYGENIALIIAIQWLLILIGSLFVMFSAGALSGLFLAPAVYIHAIPGIVYILKDNNLTI